jgi:hypothetical protein
MIKSNAKNDPFFKTAVEVLRSVNKFIGGGIMGNSEVLPFKECPSFDTCSAPKCPLDPDIELRSDRL